MLLRNHFMKCDFSFRSIQTNLLQQKTLGTNVPSPFCSYDDADHMQIVTAGGAEPGIALSETGTELIITGASGEPGSSKVIGSREFARYYKQRHRPNENREVVLVNQVIGR